MTNILITGANGLLGHQVCVDGLAKGYNVTAVTRNLPQNPLQGAIYLPLDFNTPWRADDLPRRIDTIVHLAQSPNFRNFLDAAPDVFRVNIESTAQLLDYAKQVQASRFILASSGGVYGYAPQAHTEAAPVLPPAKLGYYLASKLSSEMLVMSYSSVFQVIILRFFFIYGHRQKREMLIPRLMDQISRRQPVSLSGADGLLINPIHVADASAALIASLETTDSDIYNVAGPEILSLRTICEAMGAYLRVPPVFEIQAGQPNGLIGDTQHMQKKLHRPRISLFQRLGELAPGSD